MPQRFTPATPHQCIECDAPAIVGVGRAGDLRDDGTATLVWYCDTHFAVFLETWHELVKRSFAELEPLLDAGDRAVRTAAPFN